MPLSRFRGVVIACVDENHIIGHPGEQIPGKVSNLPFGDRHRNNLARPGSTDLPRTPLNRGHCNYRITCENLGDRYASMQEPSGSRSLLVSARVVVSASLVFR
jgi:hypothetical protein